jgi:hypothetical protein
LEGRNCGLIWDIILTFAWREWGCIVSENIGPDSWKYSFPSLLSSFIHNFLKTYKNKTYECLVFIFELTWITEIIDYIQQCMLSQQENILWDIICKKTVSLQESVYSRNLHGWQLVIIIIIIMFLMCTEITRVNSHNNIFFFSISVYWCYILLWQIQTQIHSCCLALSYDYWFQ